MPYIVSRWFQFEAAHHLPLLPKTFCEARMHGHTFSVGVFLRGRVNQDSGLVNDQSLIAETVEPSIMMLDHHLLNEIPGLENPTPEAILEWIWNRVAGRLRGLVCLKIKENNFTEISYDGPGDADHTHSKNDAPF
jgi:6-pyruvoyltetrahydropterin/6-carboxytetrahydropterin synthase